MNFEQLSKHSKKKTSRILKKKKFFEFYIDEIKFYDLIIFQNINIRIINVPIQDKVLTSSDLIPEKNFDSTDFVIILFIFIIFYFFLYEFLVNWYNENILYSKFDLNNYNNYNDKYNKILSSNILSNFSFSKKTSKVLILFNSTMLDFFNEYGYFK